MALKEYFHFTGPSSFPAHSLQSKRPDSDQARVTPLEGTALFFLMCRNCDGDLLMPPTDRPELKQSPVVTSDASVFFFVFI